MRLITGLGNPGREYEQTRHNIGFMVVDRLAEEWDIRLTKSHSKAQYGEGKFQGEKVLLVKPMTYMNLSGEAIGGLLRWYKLTPSDLLVIYDDLDMEPGKLRIRSQGSAGGHNGIKSIIQHLGTQEFDRLKIGIGRPQPMMATADYVLSRFAQGEQDSLVKMLDRAVEAVGSLLKDGAVQAANLHNGN